MWAIFKRVKMYEGGWGGKDNCGFFYSKLLFQAMLLLRNKEAIIVDNVGIYLTG